LEIVESVYRSWAEGDFVEVLCAMDPEIRVHRDDGLPYRGDSVGREAVAATLRDLLSDWRRFEITPLRATSDGDDVLVFGSYEAEGRATGFHFEDRFTHVWRLRDGRAVEVGFFRSPVDALRALDQQAPALAA
jgi:ketosteroid isomerase-like protein